jgi:hypothetical protein
MNEAPSSTASGKESAGTNTSTAVSSEAQLIKEIKAFVAKGDQATEKAEQATGKA